MGGILAHDGKGERGMSSSYPSHSSFWFPVILFSESQIPDSGSIGGGSRRIGPHTFCCCGKLGPWCGELGPGRLGPWLIGIGHT